MDPLVAFWIFLIGIIAGVIIGLTLIYRTAIYPLHKKIEELSATYGKIPEQLAKFMEKYPYDPDRFRYIGKPIDGIQFEDDKIIFIEFKTNQSKPAQVQNKIKKLVKNAKVEWFEFTG